MPIRETQASDEPAEFWALRALAWVLSDDARAERFVALTGIAPDDLRARADDPAVLDATLGFLEGHQPDMVACAEALATTPVALAGMRDRLAQ